MREELKHMFRSARFWIAFGVSLLTLMGYSAAYWLGSADEWLEYRESALHLSLGGIFFGGFMLLLPFCAALAHSTSQIEEENGSVMQWRALRSSAAKYVAIKAGASMIGAAVATMSAFVLHAIIWNIIALPCDPATYPNHAIYFDPSCVFYNWYTICYGLPVYLEVAVGIAFTASVWAAVALAVAVWIPDQLLTVTIPSFLYYLWNADVIFFFFGIRTPHPATLFNDGLTPQKAAASVISYLAVLAASLAVYYAGCKRRCENA